MKAGQRLGPRRVSDSPARPVGATIFDLKGATATYNNHRILHDISLTIRAGERVALVGRSGAGKSTLLRLLFDTQPRDTALVPQEFGLVRTLSVLHNVYMGRLHKNPTWYNLVNLLWPLNKEKAAVHQILTTLGIAEKMFASVGELSGGQQQRVAIARAIRQDGQVLLGDEPVSALDDHQSHVALQSLCAHYPTFVLAMHDVALALAYTDRVLGIHQGQVVLDAPTAGLDLQDLSHLYGP
ncbi:MAG: ATP-binding cassette domain-containing protein [Gammaproteobacteria bacterium]|nr:ATP-binding cassette domain-containing protein [Gammaproteobacteria bacterium]